MHDANDDVSTSFLIPLTVSCLTHVHTLGWSSPKSRYPTYLTLFSGLLGQTSSRCSNTYHLNILQKLYYTAIHDSNDFPALAPAMGHRYEASLSHHSTIRPLLTINS